MALSPDGRTLALGCGDNTIRLWDVVKGELTQCFVSDHPVGHIVFSADGERLASGGPGRTILIWDVGRPPRSVETAARLSRQELNELWGDLAGADAVRAFKAQRALAAAPPSALELLTERLGPVVPPEPERVRRLITDLDSESFTVREQAMSELQRLGDGTELSLRQALEQRPSLELRRRIDRLLEGLAADSAEHLQVDRALEVLEWLDTPEARRLLRTLAGGARGAWRTVQAEAALRRLDRRRPVARRP